MQSTAFRRDIQGLRAIAVLAIIAFHFDRKFLPNGYLGVDLFFVVSGYVITASLARSRTSSFSDFLLAFYDRRIRRLLPALIVCVIVTTLIGFLFISPYLPHFEASWKTGIASVFGLSNVALARRSTDYFAVSTEYNLFTQTWSLGVEEQFYAIFPLLTWITGYTRLSGRGNQKLLITLSVMTALSLLLFFIYSLDNRVSNFFLMTTRFWEIGCGALSFLFREKIGKDKYAIPLVHIISLALLISFFFISPMSRIEGTVGTVALTCVLLLTSSLNTPSTVLLSSKALGYIGMISYSLYLWHWSVLVICRWTIGVHSWSIPFQLGLALALSALSYHLIEEPLRQRSWAATRQKTILLGFLASLSCSVFLLILGKPLKGFLYTGDIYSDHKTQIVSANAEGLSSSSEFQKLRSEVKLIKRKCNMTPQYLRGEDFQDKPNVDHTFIENCLASAGHKVVLVGDSFSEVISTHVAFAARKIEYDFRFIFGYGCSYPLDPSKITFSFMRSGCEIDASFLKSEILQFIRPGDIVVLRMKFPKYLDYQSQKNLRENLDLISAFDQEISEFSAKISERKGSLLLIGANPSSPDLPNCHMRRWFNTLQSRDCESVRTEDSPLSLLAFLQDKHMAERFSNRPEIRVIAPTPLFCDKSGSSCELIRDGRYIWSDTEHITEEGVDLFYQDIEDSLASLSKIAGRN